MKKIQKVINFCRDKRIVVVGNSCGLINPSKKGKFIDSHDVIIRFNYGYPKKEFQPYIGKKTTIWSCAISSKTYQIKCLDLFKNEVKFVIQPHRKIQKCLSKELSEVTTYIPIKFYIDIFCKMNNHLENPKDHLFNQDIKLAVPTSGSIVLNFLVESVDYKHLDIVGFDFLENKNFNQMTKRPTPQHKSYAEKTFISNLLKTAKHCTFYK